MPSILSVLLALLLVSCSAPDSGIAPSVIDKPAPHESRPPVAEQAAPVLLARVAPVPAASMEAYKKDVAQRIMQTSPEVFVEALPQVFKSIVVVEVTIDRDGRLAGVLVHRSNGYRELEKVALASVRRAGPFAAPARHFARHDGSVRFLETFLFRTDGRFRVRTFAEPPKSPQ
ncbi:MAG: TonB family protein [Betaproteobacteria bacterium]